MALLFDGLVFGLQLSMLAVGLTLIYGLGGVLNLAHGQFATVTAIVAAVLVRGGSGVLTAIVLAVLFAGVLALFLDMTLMRPVYRQHGEARVLLSLLLTLGAAFIVDGILFRYYPLTAFSLRLPVGSVNILGVRMRTGSLVASLIALTVLLGLILFLRYTRQGKAVRSLIQSEDGAQLCGINPAFIRTGVFVVSGMLAGMVAVTQGLIASVGPADGIRFTIMALIVTVVGGLGSVTGALFAGVLLGIINVLSASYVGTFFTFVILLLVAMVTILVRPSGLMGRAVTT
jgi:branched-chain amino acid transport system permease protein